MTARKRVEPQPTVRRLNTGRHRPVPLGSHSVSEKAQVAPAHHSEKASWDGWRGSC
jgi:hypothetical protein